MKIEKKQFHGSLDFLEGELYKVEIFFDDTAKDVINKKTEAVAATKKMDLSEKMLKSAFGQNFDTMKDEAISDYPNSNSKPGDFHYLSGVMPTPF